MKMKQSLLPMKRQKRSPVVVEYTER